MVSIREEKRSKSDRKNESRRTKKQKKARETRNGEQKEIKNNMSKMDNDRGKVKKQRER